MKLVHVSILFVAAGFLLASPLYARTWYVKPDGTGDVPTIQAAVFAAARGDTVSLSNGEFSGAGNFDIRVSSPLHFRSASEDPSLCTIDCGGEGFDSHRGFLIESAAVSFHALTIQGAHAPLDTTLGWDAGAALSVRYGSEVDAYDCVFRNNWARCRGGAVDAYRSTISFENCAFVQNTGSGGGGGAASLRWYCTAAFTNCRFEENRASGGGANGGAVRVDHNSIVSFTSCQLVGNSSDVNGGALMAGEASTVIAEDCLLAHNVSGSSGGAAWGYINTQFQWRGCTITRNGNEVRGGGLSGNRHTTHQLERTILRGNCSPDGHELALHDTDSSVSFSCCAIDTTGLSVASGQVIYAGANVFVDVGFCEPGRCLAPYSAPQYGLASDSPCAPANSPFECGLIGALPVACEPASAHPSTWSRLKRSYGGQ